MLGVQALLRDELSMATELLELEPDCKWVLAASAFLSEQLAATGARSDDERRAYSEQLHALGRVDSMRSRYYADVAEAAKETEA